MRRRTLNSNKTSFDGINQVLPGRPKIVALRRKSRGRKGGGVGSTPPPPPDQPGRDDRDNDPSVPPPPDPPVNGNGDLWHKESRLFRLADDNDEDGNLLPARLVEVELIIAAPGLWAACKEAGKADWYGSDRSSGFVVAMRVTG